MATYYTDVSTNQQTGVNFPGGGVSTQPGSYNNVLLENGNVTLVTATYTMTGSEAANDIINIVELNEGTAVVPYSSTVVSNAAASTITLDIGDTDPSGTVTNRYAAGLNVATSGTYVPLTGGALAGGISPFFITADNSVSGAGSSANTWLTAKFATLATPSAGKVIVFRIAILQAN